VTALYWPLDEYDCTPATRAIEHPSTVHLHFTSETKACAAFVELRHNFTTLYDRGDRYHCIRGPRGLLRGVRS
jgi:hypothetical protein